MKRRQFIQGILPVGAMLASPAVWAQSKARSKAQSRVVVVGGGYAGATAAKYLRLWGEQKIEVTLVEANPQFVSCPLSNLVLGGFRQMSDITLSYDNLVKHHGIRLVQDYAQSVDKEKQVLKLAGGQSLPYDRLILSPGVDFLWDQLPGMQSAEAQQKIMHAWKAGPQTATLRKQLEAMQDGGTFVISIPPAPFRCPPGPYERACQVAAYFAQHKKKSKVLILDANDDVLSKGPLFKKAWAEHYKGIVEYVPKFTTADVDAASNTVISDFGDKMPGAVINVIPPQRAGAIAVQAGVANMNKRWCEVDFLTFESTQAKNIHILGDAIQVAPLMPKSGHMANQHAKVCAAAVVDLFNGDTPNQAPMLNNTCYSYVSEKEVVHIASVHAYSAEKKTFLSVPGAGGLSVAANEQETAYAESWAQNIWADTLA
ncbi:NAD(P)/FAD-dependent oxidoreductase [Undibacterium terreum]|uniref:Cytochrome c n=1 Tax=Undibacterium terreum TaxID=1224302 RepID=A0A916UUX4_9BURK|nr:NAD(P)/FAD-dependent oxidoreductase [Undibacterium terreum]GGC87986.1 cytochrome c [Undibacterium terreum]